MQWLEARSGLGKPSPFRLGTVALGDRGSPRAFSLVASVFFIFLEREEEVMQPLLSALPVMSVSTIFYAWHFYRQILHERRHRTLCARVAYLLWMAAHHEG